MRKITSLQKQSFPLPDVLTKVVPTPTDGWDALSPLALMDPKRAPILINWVPRPGWVELRAGYNTWANVSSVPVETLMVWRGPSTQKMFAGSGTSIYDVTTSFLPTTVRTGQSSARYIYTNFISGGGVTVIQIANGLNPLLQYDGTSWTQPSITGLPGGLGTSSIRAVYAQKQRLWYLLNNSLSQPTAVVAFLGTGNITGAIAGSYDFGSLLSKGGYIQAMADWTVDGGNGPQDYVVFISSQGQVIIFSGTDPTSSSTWSLVGVFNLPQPIGTRCATQIGSDVAIITQQGILPLSSALPFDPSADRSVAITSRIQNAFAQSANNYSGNYGWQTISFPAQQLIIVNVPITENSQQVQYVMNTLTGAWCQFTGWNSNTFEIFNGNLYWGDNSGNVNQGYTGSSDLFATINADMQCAFNYFDDPGRIKRVTMIQPLITSAATYSPTLSIDTDFATSTANAPVTTVSGGSLWDAAKWDAATWSGGISNTISWYSAEAIGHALAVRMKINFSSGASSSSGVFNLGTFDNATFDSALGTTNPSLQINAFNLVMELGGYI